MINDFEFKWGKTQYVFADNGRLKAGQYAKDLGLKKIMLVADKGVRNAGLLDDIEKSLKNAGLTIVSFDKIVPNPLATDCEEGAKFGMEEEIDGIVAVGGGSSIDTGKAIAGMIGHESCNFEDIMFPKAYTKDPLPLIAIPTTAGTGSEMATGGVITVIRDGHHVKENCWDPRVAVDVALTDPQLIMNLPNSIAAATAMDALTHALESYVSKEVNPILEAIGIYAVKLIHKNIRKYIHKRDLETCKAIMIGSSFAGLSFGYSDVGNAHVLAEVVGGWYDISHGVGNSIFLPYVAEYDAPSEMEKYCDLAKAMGIRSTDKSDREVAKAVSDELKQLAEDIMIPKFSSFDNVNPEDFQKIAEECQTNIMNEHNPRYYYAEDFYQILKQAYEA